MCTVTLTPLSDVNRAFILTFSRDEAPGRNNVPPEFHNRRGTKMFFPRDAVAGGTWLGISERQRVVCLLNGAFHQHHRTPPYRLSRGVVVLDFLVSPDFDQIAREYDLEQIEPFTMIAIEWKDTLRFTELVWDGTRKHQRYLPLTPHIWSSTPLYSEAMKAQRNRWFRDLSDREPLTRENLLEFHQTAGIGDPEVDVVMDRGFVRTHSISQVSLVDSRIRFFYKELHTGKESTKTFSENLQV